MTTLINGKALIKQTAEGLRISIPSRKTWLLLAGASLWMGGWAIGFIKVLNIFLTRGNAVGAFDMFFAVWLVLWTLGGISVTGMLLWGYFGREDLFIPTNQREVFFKKHILGIGVNKKLEKSQIRNFTFNEVPTDIVSAKGGLFVWGLGTGKIKFDYGMKTYSMGLGLDDAEANYIIYLLDEKLG